jgi:DNA topoisomerase I
VPRPVKPKARVDGNNGSDGPSPRPRRGRGFSYVDEDGRRVGEPEVLARIAELAIPPAWEDVWICPYPNGHLQATGTDAAGRKQYRYHDAWRTRRDAQKFDDMVLFAKALPRLRRRVDRDLGDCAALDRSCVLACAVRLLERGFFRIGSEEYAEDNRSYGLATMRKQHVRIEDGGLIVFDHPAKSGQRSEDINEYLKKATGGDHSAKDFRTWNATALAAVALAVAGASAHTKTARKRAIKRAVEEVAVYLGNTPAVCRASYIDPRVFDAFAAGLTIRPALERVAATRRPGELPIHQPALERAALDLIDERTDTAAVERVAG